MGLLDFTQVVNNGGLPDKTRKLIQDYKKRIQKLDSSLKKQLQINNDLVETIKESEKRKNILHNKLIFNKKTGLPNHHVLDDDLGQIFKKMEKHGELIQVGVFILGLNDSYTMLEKTLKPVIIEWVLFSTSERIRELFPDKNMLYHPRDDEFIIVVQNPGRDFHTSCQKLASDILSIIAKSHIFSGYNITIGCNIGCAVFPQIASNKEQLLRNADIAMSVAKRDGIDYILYTEELHNQVIEKVELQNYILKALEEQAITEIDKQFELFFQPIEKIEIRNNGYRTVTMGAEALIRWQHPEKGMISPVRFIPVAEETGLIIPIGTWVLYTACDQIYRLNVDTDSKIAISVNISARQFKDQNLVQNVKSAIQKSGIDPSNLILEITESSVMENPDDAIKKMSTLRQLGLRLSIDDFGTGYSSLSYLKKLPVSILKIDKAFIDDVEKNDKDQGIVKAIISMAHEMGMRVVAEGVENRGQLEFLIDEGCLYIQGYLFSKPLTSDKLISYIEG
jgi:diguanylate cyclase